MNAGAQGYLAMHRLVGATSREYRQRDGAATATHSPISSHARRRASELATEASLFPFRGVRSRGQHHPTDSMAEADRTDRTG